ncbi:agglutinin biogenesis protein MshP [Massilia glaciei]|uniref:Agglutinin biogenesis protein MshP n=1 Tax=Massilia glaciei TaxID=1524097 RepID=A0A2U2HJU6_9BURK|nr:agglutinin biogenesis protein MshP [Massilia glaciei]PWF47732.1 agglutinin biogenesis protein MshP [Massilia glaciei]
MNRSKKSGSAPRRQRGLSMIAAVFLLVVLAGLAAALVSLFTVQQASSGLDVLGARTYQAARAGMQWGLYQQLRVQPPSIACFASPSTFRLPADASLAALTVTVTCAAHPGNAAGNTTNRWTLTATACNEPGAAGCPNASPSSDYTQRRLQAELN